MPNLFFQLCHLRIKFYFIFLPISYFRGPFISVIEHTPKHLLLLVPVTEIMELIFFVHSRTVVEGTLAQHKRSKAILSGVGI